MKRREPRQRGSRGTGACASTRSGPDVPALFACQPRALPGHFFMHSLGYSLPLLSFPASLPTCLQPGPTSARPSLPPETLAPLTRSDSCNLLTWPLYFVFLSLSVDPLYSLFCLLNTCFSPCLDSKPALPNRTFCHSGNILYLLCPMWWPQSVPCGC